MKRKFNHFYLSLLGGVLLTLGACNDKNDDITPQPIDENLGVYVLNEGNFGSNNASVGVYNFSKQAYETILPNIGDTGNDIGRYGNKLYVVVNGGSSTSGKLLVYDITNSERIGDIPMDHPRFIKFYKGKAYVTHGENGLSQLATGATLSSLPSVLKTIEVGRTPEQLTIFKDKIYVANSGALSESEGHDNRVSVVNVNSFSLDRSIEVANNITSIHSDTVNNTLYVNASAIYGSQGITSPSKLYAVNTSTDAKTSFTFGAEQMFISVTSAMLISSNKTEGKYNILLTNNIQNQQFTDNAISTTGMTAPYGISFVPEIGVVAVADAKDYKSNGDLYLYDAGYGMGLITKIAAGIIPKKVAFKN